MEKGMLRIPIDNAVREKYGTLFKSLSRPCGNGYVYIRGIDPIGVVEIANRDEYGMRVIQHPELNLEAISKHGLSEEEVYERLLHDAVDSGGTKYHVFDKDDPGINILRDYRSWLDEVDGDEQIVTMVARTTSKEENCPADSQPYEESINEAWSFNVLDMSKVKEVQEHLEATMLKRQDELLKAYDFASREGKYLSAGKVLDVVSILSEYEEYFDDLTAYIKAVIGDERSTPGIYNESLEYRLVNPLSPTTVTLYHSSPKKLAMILPNSLNTGTKLSGMRESSFWVDSRGINFSKAFILRRMFSTAEISGEIKGPLVEWHAAAPNVLDTDKLIADETRKAEIIKYINDHPLYVHVKTIDTKYVKIGHDETLPEYTIDFRVKPDNVQTMHYPDLKDIITFVRPEEVQRVRGIIESGKCRISGFPGKRMRDFLVLKGDAYTKSYGDAMELRGVAAEECGSEREMKVIRALDADAKFRNNLFKDKVVDMLFPEAVAQLDTFIGLHCFIDKVHDNFIEISSTCSSGGEIGAALINVYGYSVTDFLHDFLKCVSNDVFGRVRYLMDNSEEEETLDDDRAYQLI